jgi:metal-responsive CopG/Arc/MetJ family transcriptional regulator
MQPFVQLNIRLPAELAPELQRHVDASGQSRTEYVIDAIKARITAENAAVTGE